MDKAKSVVHSEPIWGLQTWAKRSGAVTAWGVLDIGFPLFASREFADSLVSMEETTKSEVKILHKRPIITFEAWRTCNECPTGQFSSKEIQLQPSKTAGQSRHPPQLSHVVIHMVVSPSSQVQVGWLELNAAWAQLFDNGVHRSQDKPCFTSHRKQPWQKPQTLMQIVQSSNEQGHGSAITLIVFCDDHSTIQVLEWKFYRSCLQRAGISMFFSLIRI